MKQQLRIMLLILAMIAGGASSELHAINGVSYVDNDGTVKQRNGVTVLNDVTQFGNLAPGWYVVTEDIECSKMNIGVYGFSGDESVDVHIIIQNGVTINATVEGIEITNYYLNVYFHAENNEDTPGMIIAINSEGGKAISAIRDITFNGLNVDAESNEFENAIYSDGNITVNSGSITATDGTHGIYCVGTFTMNGGTVSASGSKFGIQAEGGVVFNGGNLTANGTGGSGIFGNVTLKWTSPDDSFTANCIDYVSSVTIAGGYKFIDNENNIYSGSYYGYEFPYDFTLTPYIAASVTSLDGSGDEVTEFYNTLTDAFNAAKTAYVPGNGSDVAEFIPTVTLLADVDNITEGYTIGDEVNTTKVKLDLNDHTITGDVDADLISVNDGATLEIVDNGSSPDIKGTITNGLNSPWSAINVAGDGELKASGVSIVGGEGYAIENWGTADINGCELSGYYCIISWGSTTVTGTSISGTYRGIDVTDGTMTIGSGVSISNCSEAGIIYNGGTLIPNAWPTFGSGANSNAADFMIVNEIAITFGEGSFNAPTTPMTLQVRIDEFITVNPTDYTNAITTNYSEAFTSGSNVIDPNDVFEWYDGNYTRDFVVNAAGEVIFCPGMASVTAYNGGSTPTINYYATLDAALTAAKSEFDAHSGSTPAVVPKVTLFDDVTDITSSIKFGIYGFNCDLVLDLNGHTLSGNTESLIYVDGDRTLTVEDSGKDGRIVNNSTYAIYNYGTLNLHGGTIGGFYFCLANHGTMTVSGGTIDMSNAYYGIENYGTLTLNGLPKFEHDIYGVIADIMLYEDNIITFGEGTYEAPENPFVIKTSDEPPYTFTSGYGTFVRDADNKPIDPGKIFVAKNKTSGDVIEFNADKSEAILKSYDLAFSLSDNADNSGEIILNRYGTATLAGRTIMKDGTWNTLCLPFDVTLSGSPLQDFTVKELNASASSLDVSGQLTIEFTAVTDKIKAGKPYILKWTGTSGAALTEDDLVFPNVTITSTEPEAVTFSNANGAPCQFVGQYSPFEINDGTATEGFHSNVNNIDEILFLATTTATHSTVLGYSQSPRRLRACRTHFWVPARQTAGGEPVSPVRSFVLDFGDGNDATGVVELKNSRIEELNSDDGWYSVDGRKLSGEPKAKGLYIHNGKKMIIK